MTSGAGCIEPYEEDSGIARRVAVSLQSGMPGLPSPGLHANLRFLYLDEKTRFYTDRSE